MNKDDRILAGKNVTVNADTITNNGKVQAGYGDRNITITDEMLTHFVKDPVTGEDTEVIDLQGSDVSDYLSENNNIKILYTDADGDGKKEIVVFNTSTEGGNVTFNGKVSGNGEVRYTDGYSNITIKNETNNKLVVNNIANNRMDGKYTINGTIQPESANVINQGHNFANTEITSNGTIDVKGLIENAKGKKDGDSTGLLNIASKNGVNILNKLDEKGTQIATIDAVGQTAIKNETAGGINVEGLINQDGSVEITNHASGGITIAETGFVNNTNGTTTVTNTSGKLTVKNGGKIVNNNGQTIVKNSGAGGMEIAGLVNNKKGETTVENTNATLKITETGKVENNNGALEVKNSGTGGMDIDGKVATTNASNITLTSSDADIVIGHDNTDNNVQSGGSIIVNQTDGDVLNYGGDKTMLKASSDLIMNVIDGNIGATSNTNPGFSVNASTRDYKETLNINIGGTVTANAENSTANPDAVRLVNLRSKASDMKVNHIKADGNVILTAADWKQPDQNPTPDDEAYFRGYSITNAAADGGANIEGQNISVISSNEIGASDKALTYSQRTDVNPDSWVSFEAENDIKLENVKSDNPTNIWQLISKRGSIDFTLGSEATINEITSGNHLHLLSKAKNLTIYNIGKTSSFEDPFDDLLYPHDLIKLGTGEDSVVPQTVAIEVLDLNGGEDANSTLRIYNAYVRGANNGQGAYEDILGQTFQKADVSLMADNIYANAYDAAESNVSTVHHPDGFDPKENGSYELNGETHYATGFNTVGDGAKLSFDIEGVNKDFVSEVNNGDTSTRTYTSKEKYETIEIFNNKFQVSGGNAYLADDVAISVNTAPGTADTGYNRGMNINKIYANDAYVDTKDLNLSIRDGIINNYAEFRNGNRGGEGNYGGDYDYRWLAVVDNDFRRLIDSTVQLYTQKTGSFALDMGNLVILKTKSPIVNYNPYEVVNLFGNENSFVRLTYKDDKIQYNTTQPDFKDIDKATYKATKRVSMRFPTKDQNISADVPIYDISKTGALIDNSNNLKVGDHKKVKIIYEDMVIDVEVEVVRVADNGVAGVKFVNLNKATANKILYMNLRRANSMKETYTSNL